ncbi:MAG: PRC-barrel domain-containing protein [bacterium]
MNQDDRDMRDAAGVGPYARELDALVPMNTLHSWKVADGEPDIRGWEVQTVSNRKIGTVQDLLIDASVGEVVLLDIDLSGTDRHALVPIRIVQIDRPRRIVLMDSADLPDGHVASERAQHSSPRHTDDARLIRYPRPDREVVVERPPVNDAMLSREHDLSPDDVSATAVDRRRNERRVIHRMSTDV